MLQYTGNGADIQYFKHYLNVPSFICKLSFTSACTIITEKEDVGKQLQTVGVLLLV